MSLETRGAADSAKAKPSCPRLLPPEWFRGRDPVPACFLLLSRIELRKFLAQMLDLGRIVKHDVGLMGMQGGVVLMIGLGRIERLQRHNPGHDRAGEYTRFVELRDVGLGDALLLIVALEN